MFYGCVIATPLPGVYSLIYFNSVWCPEVPLEFLECHLKTICIISCSGENIKVFCVCCLDPFLPRSLFMYVMLF